MSAIFRAMAVVVALMVAASGFAQSHVRAVSAKIRTAKLSATTDVTYVVKRERGNARRIRSTILEVVNLPSNYTKDMVKAIEKDEKYAHDNTKSTCNGVCSHVLKFEEDNCLTSVAICYNPKTMQCYSLVVREDYLRLRSDVPDGEENAPCDFDGVDASGLQLLMSGFGLGRLSFADVSEVFADVSEVRHLWPSGNGVTVVIND